ncbi:MAG: hypothetical protein WCG49_03210 [Actinomycetes bacterium]
MSFTLGTTCGLRCRQHALKWVQSGVYPPQRTHVRLPLWKTVDNQRGSFSFPRLVNTTVIHNSQPLLQALDIYLPTTINNTARLDGAVSHQRSRHEVSL